MVTNFCCVSGWSRDFAKRGGQSKLNPRLIFSLDSKPGYLKQLPEFVFLEPARFIARSQEFMEKHAENILRRGRMIPFMFVLMSEHTTRPLEQVRREFPAALLEANGCLHHYCFCMCFTDLFWVQELGCFIEIERAYVAVTHWNMPRLYFDLLSRVVSYYRMAKLRELENRACFGLPFELERVAQILQQ